MKYIVYFYRIGYLNGKTPRDKKMKGFGTKEDAEKFIEAYLHEHWLEAPHTELWRQCEEDSYAMEYYNEGEGKLLQLAFN